MIKHSLDHLCVVYQDEAILAINKPAGLLCHPVGHYQGDTLLARVQYYFGKDARLVHRLDQGTSGIMIIARNMLVAQILYEQFSSRKIQKEYIALVYGRFPYEEGMVNLPLASEKSQESMIKIKMKGDPHGLPSLTTYKLIKRSDSYSLLKLHPETGRKHQIRIHLASLGYPVLNEPLYQHEGLPFLWEYYFSRKSPWQTPIKGLGLHACQIDLQHPFSKDGLSFRAKPPEDWANFLDQAWD
ncbi:MAG: RluA family pseudouridine synthase [Candidatus Brocadiae bacterium]|nr:RluA family pseudouridine synthase [Candidatus Brocadiia bacterium]